MTSLKILIVIFIITGIVVTLMSKKKTTKTSNTTPQQTNSEDVKSSAKPERVVNEHVRSVIFGDKKYNVYEGSRLHQLALKNKRKVTR